MILCICKKIILESNKGCDILKKIGSGNKWIELSMVESRCHVYSKSIEFGFIALCGASSHRNSALDTGFATMVWHYW